MNNDHDDLGVGLIQQNGVKGSLEQMLTNLAVILLLYNGNSLIQVKDKMNNVQICLEFRNWYLDEVLLLAMPKKDGWGGLADCSRVMEVVVSR